MKKRSGYVVSALILSSVTLPLYAADWALSFGGNSLQVKGARPLEEAPNADNSYTQGIQVAIVGKSSADSYVQQSGYFKIFVDRDKDKLDPDHIPIWFMGNYQAKAKLTSFSQNTSLNMLMDLDSKANSVSSVERQIKLFGGVSAEYNTDAFSAGLKATAGRFALEIDDDVPKTRGYGRSDFKRIEYAYSVMADTKFALGDAFALYLRAQTWQTGDKWLENQYRVELEYDSNSWAKDSTFVVSILRSEYNLEDYNHPGEEPILPWNKDTLLQAYIVIPWNF